MTDANLFDPFDLHGLKLPNCILMTGKHAAPWEQGIMIWESLQDIFRLLREEN